MTSHEDPHFEKDTWEILAKTVVLKDSIEKKIKNCCPFPTCRFYVVVEVLAHVDVPVHT